MSSDSSKPRNYVRQRKFNGLWRVERLVLQVMLHGFQGQQWALRLIPSVTIAHNEKMQWVIGLDWIFGDVNFGWAQADFVVAETARLKEIEKVAAKTGITIKQQKLRWEGY